MISYNKYQNLLRSSSFFSHLSKQTEKAMSIVNCSKMNENNPLNYTFVCLDNLSIGSINVNKRSGKNHNYLVQYCL